MVPTNASGTLGVGKLIPRKKSSVTFENLSVTHTGPDVTTENECPFHTREEANYVEEVPKRREPLVRTVGHEPSKRVTENKHPTTPDYLLVSF